MELPARAAGRSGEGHRSHQPDPGRRAGRCSGPLREIERVADGDVVVVYDLGGGTFDVLLSAQGRPRIRDHRPAGRHRPLRRHRHGRGSTRPRSRRARRSAPTLDDVDRRPRRARPSSRRVPHRERSPLRRHRGVDPGDAPGPPHRCPPHSRRVRGHDPAAARDDPRDGARSHIRWGRGGRGVEGPAGRWGISDSAGGRDGPRGDGSTGRSTPIRS